MLVDKSWTLFLDRDGVLNRRIIGGYVLHVDQFEWLPGVLPGLAKLTPLFGRTIIVTNQQGVGKGLMSTEDLRIIHSKMRQQAAFAGANIDAIYACTALASANAPCRKPSPGMADTAKQEFPRIDFAKSVIVGDSVSDMQFGQARGMRTVFVGKPEACTADQYVANLWEFALSVSAA